MLQKWLSMFGSTFQWSVCCPTSLLKWLQLNERIKQEELEYGTWLKKRQHKLLQTSMRNKSFSVEKMNYFWKFSFTGFMFFESTNLVCVCIKWSNFRCCFCIFVFIMLWIGYRDTNEIISPERKSQWNRAWNEIFVLFCNHTSVSNFSNLYST